MVQFHLGHSQVIGIDAQISGEEILNVPFTLYTAADGRIILVSTGYKVQSRTPGTIESHNMATRIFIFDSYRRILPQKPIKRERVEYFVHKIS